MVRRLIVGLSFLAACSHAPRTSSSHDRSLITRDEIASVTGATSMYDVIRRLRNEYLTGRGRTSLVIQTETRPVVFMDEQEFGTIEALRNIEPGAVQEVQYFPSSQAVARFGSRYGAGVIQLRTRGS
jgi:hypothetical protein